MLARSGMGSVLKARQRSTGPAGGSQGPHFHLESDIVFYSRFEREEQIGLRLHHPAIAATLPVTDKSRPYLVMEYVAGRSLRTIMNEEGPLSVERALFIADQVCGTLIYLHNEGVVHRDLKPDNILVDREGRVKIVDFGIAMDRSARRLTWAGLSSKLGTPDYMAPERIRGRRGDGRADTYALGVILYEMLTGVMPHEAPTVLELMKTKAKKPPRDLSEVAPHLESKLASVVMRAIARHPSDRFASAKDMLTALRDPLSLASGRYRSSA